MPDDAIARLYYGRHHWDFRLGTYLGLLRTMAIRSMVSRLYSGSLLRTQTFERLKRTRELVATLIVDGLDGARAKEALRRIEHAHRGVQASNDEFRYVLSVFFLEPLRFNGEFGTVPFTPAELELLHAFWMQVGERMRIERLLPSLEEWSRFRLEFESVNLGRTDQGRALARSSLYEVVRLVIPRGMQELTRQTLLATMDPRVREALDLPQARVPLALSLGALRVASWFGAGTRVPTMDGVETTR